MRSRTPSAASASISTAGRHADARRTQRVAAGSLRHVACAKAYASASEPARTVPSGVTTSAGGSAQHARS